MIRGALLGAVVLLGSGCGTATPTVVTTGESSPPSSATPAPGAGTSPTPVPTPAPSTLQAEFDTVSSGVVRLEVAGCESDATGTGFAISQDLVVTAAHVVDGGRLVRAISGTTSRSASVIGLDTTADIALLRVVEPVPGHEFTFADTALRVGDQVAALGYPEASPLAFSPGTVNGVGRKAVVDGIPRFGLIEFDAATTHGSSGGPLILADGSVVGVVDAGRDGVQGRKLAVSAQTARTTLAPWRERTSPLPTKRCASVLGPDGEVVPPSLAPGSDAAQVFGTLRLYFDSINQGDYPTALAQFIDPISLEAFSAGVESSNDTDFVVHAVKRTPQEITVWLGFTSRQQAGSGPAARPQETCTDWSLDYVMRPHNGLWLIAATRAHGAASRPCA
ncbi:MAG: serine protease, partial [Kineosporiaceae bacterium]